VIVPRFGASHLRSEFCINHLRDRSSLRRFAPPLGILHQAVFV